MQDATIERLSKIIAEPRGGGGNSGQNRRLPRGPAIHLHIGLAEGWFSLFLLATVVYSTIWCVQAAQWVNNLNILSLTTALGLIGGVIAAKQQRLPRLLVHFVAVVLGISIAFWQTAGVDYAGNTGAFVNSIHQWILLALAGGTSNDDSIFLFFITALGFLLAYTSAWLVYRTRSPWLMILANAVVLLINLSNIDAGYIVFLVVFLVAALLLLLRINLYESAVRWRRLGLRCSDDLGWEFMQAGALISIGILVFSWLLPWGYVDNNAAQIWSADNNPWVQVQNTWNRLLSVSGGYNPANHGNFTDTLILGGNPNLTNDIVLTVKTDDSSGQYLESLSYDTYSGRGWEIGPTYATPYKANDVSFDGSTDLRQVRQQVTIVNPPGEQKAYILAAPQLVSLDQSAQLVSSSANSSVVAWLRTIGKLAAGNQYTVISYVSSADVKTLESVPFPADAPVYPPSYDGPRSVNYYDPGVVRTYTQVPQGLDARIFKVAQQQTADATSMYDKAVALASYLQTFTYDVNVSLPSGAEGVSWLLFGSGHRGFCNYFATAMAIMARELGMPARVVAGYTHGTYDAKNKQWVVHGTDAHLWTQIYFAGYGWINFEPSPSFSPFVRPLTSSNGTITVTPGGSGGSTTGKNTGRGRGLPNETGTAGSGGPLTPAQQQAQIRQDVGVALLGIVLLILCGVLFFGVWWRRLFRGYGLSAQIYGRLCLLANWAGISLRRSQTPYEYIHALAEATPDQAVTLERLGDIYVRDRWAEPASEEDPRRSGEVNELPGLWKRLQPHLVVYALRHPAFLRWLPSRIWGFISKRWARRRARRIPDDDLQLPL